MDLQLIEQAAQQAHEEIWLFRCEIAAAKRELDAKFAEHDVRFRHLKRELGDLLANYKQLLAEMSRRKPRP